MVKEIHSSVARANRADPQKVRVLSQLIGEHKNRNGKRYTTQSERQDFALRLGRIGSKKDAYRYDVEAKENG